MVAAMRRRLAAGHQVARMYEPDGQGSVKVP
jgi:hypothetical protein